jgi:hypothetical protein
LPANLDTHLREEQRIGIIGPWRGGAQCSSHLIHVRFFSRDVIGRRRSFVCAQMLDVFMEMRKVLDPLRRRKNAVYQFAR